MISASVCAEDSTGPLKRTVSQDELDAAWRDGFVQGMEDWKHISFDENLDFYIPFAVYENVFFEIGFLFNGSGWIPDASSVRVFDNALLLTKDDDGGSFTMKSKEVLRLKLDVIPFDDRWCFLNEVDPEILYNVKYSYTTFVNAYHYLVTEWTIPICCGGFEQEWVFVADKPGVVALEMAASPNHTQCGPDAVDEFRVEITVE